MTDEGSAPPPVPESSPPPPPTDAPPAPPVEAPPVPATEPAPTPEPTPASEPVVSAEAIKEISEELTEAVKDAILLAPAPEPPPAASSSSSVPQPVPKKFAKGHTSSPAGEARDPSSAPSASGLAPLPSSRGSHMLTVVRARKADRLEKIVALARERGSITNDDVQLLLQVSDTTSTNYLNAVVLAGRLRRSGHDGGAKYEPI